MDDTDFEFEALSSKDRKVLALLTVLVGVYAWYLFRSSERQDQCLEMDTELHKERLRALVKGNSDYGRPRRSSSCGITFADPASLFGAGPVADFFIEPRHGHDCAGCRRLFKKLTGQELAVDTGGDGAERVRPLSLVSAPEVKAVVESPAPLGSPNGQDDGGAA